MFGEIANVSIAGMVRLLSVFRQTGKLEINGQDGEGQIYFKSGIIVGTSKAVSHLSEEVLRLFLLKEGRFSFQALESVPAKSLQGELQEIENLILESSRRMVSQEAAEYLPGDDVVLQLAPVAGEKESMRLDFLRDEWNLLTRVNGEDPMGVVREKSGIRKGRALQILYGLLSAGILRRTRFRIPKVIEIATQELGNMGEALVREAFRKLKLDQSSMHMRQLIELLNELERNVTLLLGPTRARHIIDQMWEGSKR
ncbi:DUF4388 domain-containing protein [candidate division FCPU426 bacterium]|nr:DUF4388 domain-containing protein [candidate division FCPU426 bacterium]